MDLYSYAKAAFASLSDVSRVPFYRRLYEEFQFVPGYTWTRNGEWESHGSRGPRDVSLPGFSASLSHSLSDLPLPNLVHVHVCFTSSSVLPPFLALAVYVLLSLAPADVRPSLPLLSLAPRRAYRTTADHGRVTDSLPQDLDPIDTSRRAGGFGVFRIIETYICLFSADLSLTGIT